MGFSGFQTPFSRFKIGVPGTFDYANQFEKHTAKSQQPSSIRLKTPAHSYAVITCRHGQPCMCVRVSQLPTITGRLPE